MESAGWAVGVEVGANVVGAGDGAGDGDGVGTELTGATLETGAGVANGPQSRRWPANGPGSPIRAGLLEPWE